MNLLLQKNGALNANKFWQQVSVYEHWQMKLIILLISPAILQCAVTTDWEYVGVTDVKKKVTEWWAMPFKLASVIY